MTHCHFRAHELRVPSSVRMVEKNLALPTLKFLIFCFATGSLWLHVIRSVLHRGVIPEKGLHSHKVQIHLLTERAPACECTPGHHTHLWSISDLHKTTSTHLHLSSYHSTQVVRLRPFLRDKFLILLPTDFRVFPDNLFR